MESVQWEDLLHVRNVGQTGPEAGLALHNGESIDIFGQRGGPTICGELMVQKQGKYYYEVVLETDKYFQLGWAISSFVAQPDSGKGCGDDEDGMSWGYNGGAGSMELRHARVGENVETDRGWKSGDVIGLGMDIDNATISIFLNNTSIYHSAISDESTVKKLKLLGVFPAISLARGAHCQARFGTADSKFIFSPPPDGYMPWPIPEEMCKSSLGISAVTNFNRPSVPIIPMNDGSHSYSTNQAGMLMVHMMGRGINYEAKKNAIVGAGLKWAQKILSAKREDEDELSVVHSMKEDELLAIIIYTLGHAPYPPVYRFFNSDTRKGTGAVSGNDFPILFQLLEDGCRALLSRSMASMQETQEENLNEVIEEKKSQHNNGCPLPKETYRGVGIRFQACVGDKIRFGQFTSTSANSSIAKEFIAQEGAGGTLLTIRSKLGAPIWELSEFPDEKEVLVPPCEPFRVVEYKEDGRFITLESIVTPELVQDYISDVEVGSKISQL